MSEQQCGACKGTGLIKQMSFVNSKRNITTNCPYCKGSDQVDEPVEVLRERIAALEAKVARLTVVAETLQDCAVHPFSRDLCGVCKKHFYECEEEMMITVIGPGEMDGPRDFACPGARARRVLDACRKAGDLPGGAT